MNAPALQVRADEAAPRGPRRQPPPAHQQAMGGEPPPTAHRLVVAGVRHAGLVVLCALAGTLVASAAILPWSPSRPATPGRWSSTFAVPGASAPARAGASVPPRRDPEPLRATRVGCAATDVRRPASAPGVRPATSPAFGAWEARLAEAPPAAGPAPVRGSEPAAASVGRRLLRGLGGLAAGLVLGLAAAARRERRERRGERLRSPREAEWALGVPVLGAVPTLSARALRALAAGRA